MDYNREDLEKAFQTLEKALETFIDRFNETMETIADVIEDAIDKIRETLNLPISRKYQIIKFYSKCTGKNTLQARRILHRARSNC